MLQPRNPGRLQPRFPQPCMLAQASGSPWGCDASLTGLCGLVSGGAGGVARYLALRSLPCYGLRALTGLTASSEVCAQADA